MAKNKSKIKGKGFEREVAKILTETFHEPFERVPNSGAFTGRSNAHRRQTLDARQEQLFVGDIIPPDSWNIVVECKNYKKLDGGFSSIIEGTNSQVNKWLKELQFDARESFHLLFMKFNYRGIFVAIPLYAKTDVQLFDIPLALYYFNNATYIIISIKHFSKNEIKSYVLTKAKKD